MANVKISDLAELAAVPDNADLLEIVDMGATPASKKITAGNLRGGLLMNAVLENNVLIISRPGGASYSGPSSVTGAIKITLPQSWTKTMMKFTVDVFQYAVGKSFSLELAGYNNTSDSTTSWVNTTANLTGSTAANNRVRFGHDGTKCCIYIGETTSAWSYIKVSVRDFQAGYNNYTKDQWDDGWSIGVTTTIGTITADIANPRAWITS